MHKARLTIADKKTNLADDTVDFYSPCVSPGTSRIRGARRQRGFNNGCLCRVHGEYGSVVKAREVGGQ